MSDMRELRMNKVAIDTYEYMAGLISKIESEDEMADIFRVWCMVLGGTIGQLDGAQPESIRAYETHFMRYINLGFNLELERTNGKR